MKHRRAYAACLNCRQRKIKCVTISDADNRPCTRCAQKGLNCAYVAVSHDDSSNSSSHSSSRPSTPPPYDTFPLTPGWNSHPQTTPIMTPPSAGISGLGLADMLPPRVCDPNYGQAYAPQFQTSSPQSMLPMYGVHVPFRAVLLRREFRPVVLGAIFFNRAWT
ncbi:hypothetical protein C8R44DRAFT_846177 [Mycena epipterygia]|nr:hypothetical protein C8R44DRAFT_846177 [Mycena epipterygia]